MTQTKTQEQEQTFEALKKIRLEHLNILKSELNQNSTTPPPPMAWINKHVKQQLDEISKKQPAIRSNIQLTQEQSDELRDLNQQIQQARKALSEKITLWKAPQSSEHQTIAPHSPQSSPETPATQPAPSKPTQTSKTGVSHYDKALNKLQKHIKSFRNNLPNLSTQLEQIASEVIALNQSQPSDSKKTALEVLEKTNALLKAFHQKNPKTLHCRLQDYRSYAQKLQANTRQPLNKHLGTLMIFLGAALITLSALFAPASLTIAATVGGSAMATGAGFRFFARADGLSQSMLNVSESIQKEADPLNVNAMAVPIS